MCALQLHSGALTGKSSLIRLEHTPSHPCFILEGIIIIESCPKNQDNPDFRMGAIMERIIIKTKEERKVKALQFLSIQSPPKGGNLEFA